jgi:exosome complex component RRP45
VRADVHVLAHDGGLLDAACVAVVAALRHFRRPDVAVLEGREVRVYGVRERVRVPLSMLHYPLCVTFSFFRTGVSGSGGGDGEVVLVDATAREAAVSVGELALTLNRHGEVCQMAKMGPGAVDALTLLGCTRVALVKVQEVTKFITRRLEEEEKARDVGGLLAELSAENDR